MTVHLTISIASWTAILASQSSQSFAQLPDDLKRKFDEAERRIVRLQPTAFPGLPGSVVHELQRRGCTVPQEAYTKRPHNVIRGEFLKPDQTDWAVLCSVSGSSSILVFWNGSENLAEIAKREDRNYLSGSRLGFSRGIWPAGRDVIVRH